MGDGREVGKEGGGVEGEEVRETVQLEATEAEANQQAAQLRSVVQRWGRSVEWNGEEGGMEWGGRWNGMGRRVEWNGRKRNISNYVHHK